MAADRIPQKARRWLIFSKPSYDSSKLMSSFWRVILCWWLMLDTVYSISLVGYKLIPYIQQIKFTDNTKYMNTTIKLLNNENACDMAFTFHEPIHQPKINAALWLGVKAGAVKTPFYNQTIDLCALIRNPGSHRIAQIVYREMKRHGNMPTKCPFASGLYQFRGISLNQMRLPPFFIEADAIVDIIGLAGAAKERIFEIRMFSTIKRVKCATADRC